MFKPIKIYYRIIRNKKFLLLALLLIIFLSAVIPLGIIKFSSESTRAKILRNNKIITKILPVYWKMRKISNILYLPYYFKKNNLPVYELKIKPEDVKELNRSLPDEFMDVEYNNKVYVPAEFNADGKTYQVEVRYRGDNAIHWNAVKKSYLIKFDKDQLFQGYRQLSFIIPRDRYFALEQLNNHRAEKLGLYSPPSWFANLKVNNIGSGLYFVVENWNDEMLAKWELPDTSNFYTSGAVLDGRPNEGTIWTNINSWDLLTEDKLFNFKHYSEIYFLLELLNHPDDSYFYDNIFNIIDKQSLYNWQLVQELSNGNHHITSSIRLYFDNSSGKFYFIPWDVGGGRESVDEDHLEIYGALAGRIFQNPQFAYEKNKILYQYASNQQNLKHDLDYYNSVYSSIKPALYQDRIKIYPNSFADSIHHEFEQKITQNFKRIINAFETDYISIEAHLTPDSNTKLNNLNQLAYFDINVNSRSGLYFKEVKIKLIDDNILEDYQLYYDANNNSELNSSDEQLKNYQDIILFSFRDYSPSLFKHNINTTRHRFYLLSSEINPEKFISVLDKFKFSFENAISNQEIKNKQITSKIINNSSFEHLDLISDINQFLIKNPIFELDQQSKQIYLPAGKYNINQTVIIPSGYNVTIQAGSRIYFAPKASIISYSPVNALGTVSAPIYFQPQNNLKPWGVFAVVNSPKPSYFSNCFFSYGKDDYINGVYFSGMLSLYHSDANINLCTFSRAQADDALNIKSSQANVSNSIFSFNSADAIDYDFVKIGSIKNNQFNSNGNDGIDLSGCSILIENNIIQASGDKCISVGEQSIGTVIYNNILDNCYIGVEIKDTSIIDIINNVITNNKIGLNAYQKKAVFNGGSAQVYNSIIWDNERDLQTDELSTIHVFFSNINSLATENNNFSLKPDFNPDFTTKSQNDNIPLNNGGDASKLKELLNIEQPTAPVGLNK